MGQLPLPLQLQDHAVFDSFHAVGNQPLFAFLQQICDEPGNAGCYLWGAPASGKTHLLQAVCDRVGDESVYLPLALLADAGAEVLQGLEGRQVVCIDDFERVAGNAEWEAGLFALCNQLADHNTTLIISSSAAPRDSGIELPDLLSRLSRLAVFGVNTLDESERIIALQLRSMHRGLELPDETAAYLLTRSRRDMGSLYDVLDRLDTAALIAKRRLTIPFVREVLDAQ